MVPDGTNIIINDTQRKDIDVRCLFARLYRVSLAQWLILGAEELNAILAPKIATTDALLLFPGYGSQPIKYSLSLNGFDVGSKRSFVKGKPINKSIEIDPCLVYYRNASPVSVNRLSRLLEDTPKGKETRRVYAIKYFSNGERFICALNEFGDRL